MNIFETYLKKILIIVKENHKDLGLKNLNDSKSINLEIPPQILSMIYQVIFLWFLQKKIV